LSSARQARETNTTRLDSPHTLIMNDDGLQKSIWAPRGDSNSFRRPGDWICPSCGFSNFAWRKECLRCSSVSNVESANGHLPLSAHSSPQIATPYHDNYHVNPAKGVTFETIHYTVHGDENNEPGLSTSRWAPRNYRGRANSDEIWTRVCCQIPSLCTIANTRRLSPSHPK